MPVDSETVPVGAPAPDFTLTAIDSREITLSELRGKPVVLVFLRGFMWPFCRKHLSQLRDRYGEFEQRSAQLLAIAPDTLENAQRYFQTNDIPFPSLPDPDREVFRQYDVKSAMISLGQRPGLFVIDKEGVVRYAYLGWQQWEIPSVDETLAWVDMLSLRYPIFIFDGNDLSVYNTTAEHWNNLESYGVDYPDTLFDSEGRILTKTAAEKDRVKITESGADPDPQRLREMLLHALRQRGADPGDGDSLESLIALAQATER